MQYIITALAVVAMVLLLRHWLRTNPIGSQQVYRYPFSGKLYVYACHWNTHGHRSARQDWWREVKLDGRGHIVTVGPWTKDNVGYSRDPGQTWCHPYQPLTTADLRKLDEQVRKEASSKSSPQAPAA